MSNFVLPSSLNSTPSSVAENARYEVFEELPDGVLAMTPEGRLLAANAAFLALVGRRKEDVIGCPIESIVAAEDMIQIVGVQEMFAHPAQDTSVIFTGANGTPRRLIVCSSRSREQDVVLLTARAAGAMQEELASTTRWAAAEQDRATELAQARDALAANNAALSQAQAEIGAAYAKLQGEVAAREQLEKELRLAQKLEAIGQLAAGVAHEINTPMQYIGDNVAFLVKAFEKMQAFIELCRAALAGETAHSLDEGRQLAEAAKSQMKLGFLLQNAPKALNDAKSGIEHVSNIVRAMKSFAHADQDEMALGDINRAIEDTLIVAQSEYKAVARIETDLGDLPQVVCFLGRLNQVFLNLIINAAHAIADGKRGEGLIRVRSRVEDGFLLVQIVDNGCGIPAHIQHKVFDPFFTTKPVGKGSGQGLSLARDIIGAHSGSLTFETAVGAGTTFSIRLPLTPITPPS